ncbi:tetratricopeptide repeat protein [Vibrio ouci]|uniref:tetratricopeptide repeat protein n=1 Tax=Vibrio ouci TaxID=2499078 RepID=UPI00142DC3EE|nr:tetratricopeptide repeat protein [Vibrio ouci]
MNIIGIAIGATGLLLLGMFMWMLALSLRKKRLEQERKQKAIAFRKAVERNRRQEQEERVVKAEGGDIPTILYLAKEAERKNIKEAIYWYTKAAKLDSVTGMYGVVRISNKMQQDVVLKEQAKFWQTCISASEGSLPHKFEMAQALIHGRGTEVNTPKAISVMEQAAKENYVDALVFLGDWFSPENNNDPNMSTAYYRRATELKSNEGRMKLGLNYINGVGVASNFAQGCYWLERAAEKGHLEAMYKAGEVWMGQKPNGNSLSYIWLFLAAQLGHEPSRVLRDQVALQIGVDTVVGLQSLSKPMLKKIRENKVGKHSIIKALNKLYKRKIPIDENGTLLEDSSIGRVEPIEPEQPSTEQKLDFSQSPMDKQ